MSLRSYKTIKERSLFISQETGANIDSINTAFNDIETNVHCENLVGAVTVPLGIAGPIKINGGHTRMSVYIPLATTEGALVASVNRGCKVIGLADGASVVVDRTGMTRGPVFEVKNLEDQQRLRAWIYEHEKEIAHSAQRTSTHLKFKKATVSAVGLYVYTRFYFNTEDAMGMNMVTIATENIVTLIENQTGIRCIAVAGNYDIDKKPAWLNFINNRGFAGWGEVVLSKDIVHKYLKSTPEKMFDVWLSKCMIGSAMSGSLGFNCHYANIISALYIATGQDPAHVVEGSMGITTMKIVSGGALYVSVYLPAIIVGTVGGGTILKTQTEALNITKTKKSEEFAEVVVGAVLAGELSLLASISEGSLGKVHSSLGR
ncbi:MAG: hydroxymethylglutaryl-CoA reductase [Candidatus Roizmanbacteria bacterium]